MQIFLDTANLEDIQFWLDHGFVDGITTNPSLLSAHSLKTGKNFRDILFELCELINGPVSAEVTAFDYETMMQEALTLAEIADNIIIKVPLTVDGLKACRQLNENNIAVNVTLCFSSAQALLAAKAGAAFISPFIGRLEDHGEDGIKLLKDIRSIYDNDPELGTKILAASVRNTSHVVEAAKAGADIITIPPAILESLFQHPLTDQGLKRFSEDWAKIGQSIL